jgi:5-methylcytosine-specific restriction endonuclease McrA
MHQNRSRYDAYLRSEEWAAKRKAAVRRAGHTCQVCNQADTRLEVHHRTYQRLYDEKPMDLTVLCSRCHALFHDRIPHVTERDIVKADALAALKALGRRDT